jgi:hypothetical protein
VQAKLDKSFLSLCSKKNERKQALLFEKRSKNFCPFMGAQVRLAHALRCCGAARVP